jgi:hypothetical protein
VNPWDLFTWIMAVILGVGALVVVGFFAKDLGSILKGMDDSDRGRD